MAVPACTKYNQVQLGILVQCTWLYMALPGSTWLYLTVLGCTWLYLAVSGSTWLYLTVLGCTWLYLAVPCCRMLKLKSGTGMGWMDL